MYKTVRAIEDSHSHIYTEMACPRGYQQLLRDAGLSEVPTPETKNNYPKPETRESRSGP